MRVCLRHHFEEAQEARQSLIRLRNCEKKLTLTEEAHFEITVNSIGWKLLDHQ